jgi:hypothetical protein
VTGGISPAGGTSLATGANADDSLIRIIVAVGNVWLRKSTGGLPGRNVDGYKG